ncbi:MAG: hypothetical protein ACI92E_002191, partial [Oceanicoccus sp.]
QGEADDQTNGCDRFNQFTLQERHSDESSTQQNH